MCVIFLLMAFVAAVVSCGKKAEAPVSDDSDILFSGTMSLLKEYTAKIGSAIDSASVDSLFARFTLLADSLNFAVEADTDLLLTEEENEKLYVGLDSLLSVYERRLYTIGAGSELDLPDLIEK